MKCISCGFTNLSAGVYCHRCGGKLNMSHEEIAASFHEKASQEAASNFEQQVRQVLVLSVCVFLLTLTGFLLFRRRPEGFALPAASYRAGYAKVQYQFVPERSYEVLPWDRK